MNYGEIDKRIDDILSKLESGNVEPKEAVALYEEGIKLTEKAAEELCVVKKKLDDCDNRVKSLLDMLKDDE